MHNSEKINQPPRDHSVVVPDFFGPNRPLEAWQLGWQPENRRETKTSVSKKIFNTYVAECHFNVIFYYVKDNNFYGIHAEICPTPIFRFKKEPGKFIYDELGDQDTHDYRDGEILYWVDNYSEIWDIVRIDGKSLEEVLQESYIVNIS